MQLSQDQQQLKNSVQAKSIKYLFHFTKEENLASILTTGIVPRAMLEESQRAFSHNDDVRLDGYKQASCFSLGHPNYKMFYAYRFKAPSVAWVVLGVHPRVIWEKKCAFFEDNAANGKFREQKIAEKQGIQAFEHLFIDHSASSNKEKGKLKPYYPANPQAEVLLFDTVFPDEISCVFCLNDNQRSKLKSLYPDVKFISRKTYFDPREDYALWQ